MELKSISFDDEAFKLTLENFGRLLCIQLLPVWDDYYWDDCEVWILIEPDTIKPI